MGRHVAHGDVEDHTVGGALTHRGRHCQPQPWYRDAKLAAVAAVVAAISMAATIVLLVTQPPGEAEIATAVESVPTSADPGPSTAAVRTVEPVRATLLPLSPPPPPMPVVQPVPVVQQAPAPAAPQPVSRVDPPAQKTKAPQPKVSAPPSMSFAPKPVTPPQTAAPGTNQQRHGLLF